VLKTASSLRYWPSRPTWSRPTPLTFDQNGTADLRLSATLHAGHESDGMRPGVDYAAVSFGDLELSLWAGRQAGQEFSSHGGTVRATLVKGADGHVSFSVHAVGLSLSTVKFPTSVSLRVGDDIASTSVLLQGSLQVP
jgi:hypothetical protein